MLSRVQPFIRHTTAFYVQQRNLEVDIFRADDCTILGTSTAVVSVLNAKVSMSKRDLATLNT